MGEGSLEDQAAALYAARSQPDEERQGKVLARFLELLITVFFRISLPSSLPRSHHSPLLKLAEAAEVFEHMTNAGVYPDTAAYNILIAGYGRSGKIKEAFHLFNEVSWDPVAREHTPHNYSINSRITL